MNGRKKDYEYVKCTGCENAYVNILSKESFYRGKPYCQKCQEDKKNKYKSKDLKYILCLRRHVLKY